MKRSFKIARSIYSSDVVGIVSDVQKLCIHDGPGIVSNVFLKGCNLNCKWCQNPELISDNDKNKNLEAIGKEMFVSEVVSILMQDKPFYDSSDGGVTISGGEPLMQPEFTHSLLSECKKRGLRTALETNMTYCILEMGLHEVVDLVIGDIKIMDDEKHKLWTGVSNKRIIENITTLSCFAEADESDLKIILRTPVIPDVNDNEEELGKICDFVLSLPNVWKYELVPFNPLASAKYEKLNQEYFFKNHSFLDDEKLDNLIKFVKYEKGVDFLSEQNLPSTDYGLSESSRIIENGELTNERVQILRQESVERSFHPSLTHERAEIVTKVYKENHNNSLSSSHLRSLVFKQLMETKEIYLGGSHELIVGERGPSPFVVPTFPELTCHSLEDLSVLDGRDQTTYHVSDEMVDIYREEIIPFWKGRAMRDRVFPKLPEDYKLAYASGVFTEFLEQRAPGHTVCGNKIYEKGFGDIIRDIDREISTRERKKSLDAHREQETIEKVDREIDELNAMKTCAEAIIRYGERYSLLALEHSQMERKYLPKRKEELIEISQICQNVPKNAPETFHEALQMYWFCHVAVTSELNPWDAFSPGRLCLNLEPFYQRDVSNGTLTRERAKELLQCFFIKFNNHPAPPKVGVTAEESSTYMDFMNINIGGLDINGEDAVGEVSRLLLEVISEMKLLQPSTNIQISSKTPRDFVEDSFRIVRKGYGFPGLYNTDMVVEEMVRAGKDIQDARLGGCSGCVETGAFGNESYILTGYFNLPKVLEVTLGNGNDMLLSSSTTNHIDEKNVLLGLDFEEKMGIDVREDCPTFDDFFELFLMQLEYLVGVKIRGNDIFETEFGELMPVPFLSTLIDDCIENARDYNRGGARYHTRYLQGTGLGTLSDSLSAIKYSVFDRKKFSMAELVSSLENNFEDENNIRNFLRWECPKYGNNDEYADQLMLRAFHSFIDLVEFEDEEKTSRRKSVYGDTYKVNMLSTTVHVHFGNHTAATPDGRKEREPISDGISPVCGTETNSPTGVFLSAGKMDHGRTSGTLLNMKLSPQLLEGQIGLETLYGLVSAYFFDEDVMGGHHVQFNVVTSETLREAQKDPETHKDLMVRVAGYSDYFCNLGLELQEEVILRTMHEESKSFSV